MNSVDQPWRGEGGGESPRSEEEHRRLFDLIGDAVFIHDAQGGILSANAMACTMYGYTPAEFRAMHITQVDTPGHSPQALLRIRQLMETGQLRFETEHRRKDGSTLTVEVNARQFVWNGCPAIVSVCRDITERKKTEAALRQSESMYRGLFDLAVDGIMIGSHEGVMIDANQRMCEILGMARDEFLGRHITTLPFTRESLESSALRFDLLQRGEIVDIQRNLLRPDEVEIAVEMRTKMMPDGTYQSIYRDVSERKRVEKERGKLVEQLVQAQKMESVGRLAGGVAHDFNNMLGVILGHTELALAQTGLPPPLVEGLQQICQAAERSADLTKQLLAFARKQTIAPRVLDLNETVEGMLKMLRRLIGEDIDLAWLPGSGLWPVKMDPSQIDQLLANLCVNARDAIGGVGRITIETDKLTVDEDFCRNQAGFVPGGYVLLAVSDDGCGMDEEVLSHMFEPFFTTKTAHQGTGLGLATVYGIVQQNNGVIRVTSEPGQGASFMIYLPRHEGEVGGKPAEEAGETPSSRGETILVVEDDESLQQLTVQILEKLGYVVLAAKSPGEAVDLAERHGGDIQLLLTDVVMPEMNGLELVELLLPRHPRMKHLFMSGYTADVIAHRGVLTQGVPFIAKPFTIRELAVKVREALA